MKEFLKSIFTLFFACLITLGLVVIPILPLYTFGHIFWSSHKNNDVRIIVLRLLKIIDGVLCAIAYIIYSIAIALDMIWNVFGELFEDLITHKEETYFGEKDITVSASIGQIKTNNHLNKFGKFKERVLNFFFNEKDHCGYAWEEHKLKEFFKSTKEKQRVGFLKNVIKRLENK